MARTRIAPTLRLARNRAGSLVRRKMQADELLAALEAYSMAGLASCHPATVAVAMRQARALLAVARAARGVRRYVLHGGYEGLEGPADKALFRALDRLDRLSRTPTTGEEGRDGR